MSFQKVGPFEIFGWSVAGNETCVAVRKNGKVFGFDIGFSPRPLVLADYIFISHGHADHIGAITQHMKKRALNGLRGATYFMPKHLVPHVKAVCDSFTAMAEKHDSDFVGTFIPVEPGNRFELSDGWRVVSFSTYHSIISVGYLLYYRDPNGTEVPEIAYLGDSRFTVIHEANSICPDLLSTQLLIMEATFLDNPDRRIESARNRGHTHLDEIRQNASLLKSVDYIYLIHFSDRYSYNDIIRLCYKDMPDWLVNRIVPSVTAKRCLEILNSASIQMYEYLALSSISQLRSFRVKIHHSLKIQT
ncbi:tRNase Z TRZ1 isoform 1 [Schistosoma japonicum]|uniref:TRNase Z TRZ1 isoform 1 n=1 Tax=Schistosoma japonicum TaxID=6182 RepID=A0A4Z2D7M9_SCHJA|nr:tRNase Z TRZ1 isoform 1 [Schistosoma japonicum]